jgi:hypothetical protein
MSEKKPKGVFIIIENERLEKPIWTRIGSAFVNRDDSLNLFLDALPIGGKLHVRDLKEREETPEREAA